MLTLHPAFTEDPKSFDDDVHEHFANLHRQANYTNYRMLYSLYGYHKSAKVLKRRIIEALGPLVKDSDPEILPHLDQHLEDVADLAITVDLRIRCEARKIEIDWHDPKTKKTAGFLYREDDKLMELSHISHVSEPNQRVDMITRPAVRIFGQIS
jgi:hypothetical protein